MGAADYGTRIGIAAVMGLIMLIGGRIIPSFTRNWLARTKPGRLPKPFSRYDAMSLACAAAALGLWVLVPRWQPSAAALIAAGVLHIVRLARWAGDRTTQDRLVLILHVGYGFVPLGFLLTGIAAVSPTFPSSAGIHAWAAGSIAVMTLAVMTRATLGHTGRALAASIGTQVIYALAVTAALLRIAASFAFSEPVLIAAALAWLGAFGGFVILYGPMLLLPRERSSGVTAV
jgi:uncharacterized protein involved in response to NO